MSKWEIKLFTEKNKIKRGEKKKKCKCCRVRASLGAAGRQHHSPAAPPALGMAAAAPEEEEGAGKSSSGLHQPPAGCCHAHPLFLWSTWVETRILHASAMRHPESPGSLLAPSRSLSVPQPGRSLLRGQAGCCGGSAAATVPPGQPEHQVKSTTQAVTTAQHVHVTLGLVSPALCPAQVTAIFLTSASVCACASWLISEALILLKQMTVFI